MKKCFTILVWLLLIVACSSDSDDNETLPTEQIIINLN